MFSRLRPGRAARVGRALLGVLLGGFSAGSAAGASGNLGDLTLEELMNETISVVSKREQKVGEVASSVAVLDHADLQRSGATTVAEALRTVPGVQVASVFSYTPAVGVRGFNGIFANKLLVMIDGRSVYTPLFAGTVWAVEQPFLEDVDRIEVIKGPGASVWGANAVNGVINIVSRSAEETLGGVIYAGGGNVDNVLAGARYGGRMGGKTFYRVYASTRSQASLGGVFGISPLEERRSLTQTAGFRVDHRLDEASTLTWQGDLTALTANHGATHDYNVNTLGRWSRRPTPEASIEIQAYYDRLRSFEPGQMGFTTDTFDVTVQQTFAPASNQLATWGAGARHIRERLEQTAFWMQVRRPLTSEKLFSAFVQYEVKAIPERLTLTVGSKLEHNDFTGLEVQPSVRGVLKFSDTQSAWAAVSRAVRSPSEWEGRGINAIVLSDPIVGPGGALYLPQVVGHGAVKSEVMLAYEAGYRVQLSRHASVDVSTFYNDYTGLLATREIRFVPGVPIGQAELPLQNISAATSYGGEVAVTSTLTDRWRLTGGYALLVLKTRDLPGATPFAWAGGDAKHQASLRSSHDLGRVALDLQGRWVDRIRTLPSYFAVDVCVAFHVSDRLELELVGRNLTQAHHREQEISQLGDPDRVPRSGYGKITWRF